MLIKNEEKTGTVIDLGSNGEGIIKEQGEVVFVPFSLPDEKIRYKILKATSKCAYGKVIEVLTPSAVRIKPPCPYFYKCGGCGLQHVKYGSQLKIKEKNVENCFNKIAGLQVKVNPTVKSKEFRYRNKLQLPVSFNGVKNDIGFYAENSHRVIPINDCLINPEWTADIIKVFAEFFDKYKIKGYIEQNNSGLVREITVKELNGNLIICVVINGDNLPNSNELIDLLKTELKCKFSLFINVNKKGSNAIYGEDFRLLYGEKEYSAEMLGIKYKIGVRSFMQVNSLVTEKLYSYVLDMAGIDENTVVIDAYSGAGLMTCLLSKNACRGYGIEIIGEAVEIANELASENGLNEKVSNIQGKCELILPDIIEKEKKNCLKTVLILDPPRKGVEPIVAQAVRNSGIDKVIYVSCMPSTLARDIGLITGTLKEENGAIVKTKTDKLSYGISCVQTFDMFAETKHVETVCVLDRNL